MKDEPDALLAPKKKVMRFTPKIPPPRKLVKREAAKIEPTESKNEVIDKELLSKLHNTNQSQGGSGRWLYKNGKRVSSPHVAFGDEDASKARTFGDPKSSVTGRELQVQEGSDVPAPYSAAEGDDYYENYDDCIDEQDYSSYYRISLPFTKPDFENPESHAIQEFGETSTCSLDEPPMNAAAELGLMEEKEEPELIFFQLPTNLPLWKRPAAAEEDVLPANKRKGNEPKKEPEKKEGCRLEELPGGFMGKLRVYKSGRVKLKLGDSEFDVSPGAKTLFAQEVAAINTKDQHCCILGDITKRAVVTPDIDSLLDSIDNLNVRRH